MLGFGDEWVVMYHYTSSSNAEKIIRQKGFNKGAFFSPVFLKPSDAALRLFIGNPLYNLKTTSCLAVKVSKRAIKRLCRLKALSKPKDEKVRNLYEIEC